MKSLPSTQYLLTVTGLAFAVWDMEDPSSSNWPLCNKYVAPWCVTNWAWPTPAVAVKFACAAAAVCKAPTWPVALFAAPNAVAKT